LPAELEKRLGFAGT